MSENDKQPALGSALPPFVLALIANVVWINASEVFRYFALVMPMMREAFPTVPDVAPMSVPVFLVWGLWDTIVVLAATLVPWIASRAFGSSILHFVGYGTGVWLGVFVVLWLGLLNMNLATANVLFVALPLAWIEMIVAALIVWWFTVNRANDSGRRMAAL
ncbi:MAG: hypothetical protein AAFN07_16685 [Pseudomonadota bacterium]